MARADHLVPICRYTTATVIAITIELALRFDRGSSAERWLGCWPNAASARYVYGLSRRLRGRDRSCIGGVVMFFSGACGLGLLSAGGGGAS
jgi:hypothetical protein